MTVHLAVETPDDYTLVIKLVSPCPYFNDLMAFPTFYPVHQASVEAADPDGAVPGKWAQEAGFVCNGALHTGVLEPQREHGLCKEPELL